MGNDLQFSFKVSLVTLPNDTKYIGISLTRETGTTTGSTGNITYVALFVSGTGGVKSFNSNNGIIATLIKN